MNTSSVLNTLLRWILLLTYLFRSNAASPRSVRGREKENMAQLVVPELTAYTQDKTSSSITKESAFLEEALTKADQETVQKIAKAKKKNAPVVSPRIVGGSNAGTDHPYFSLLLKYDMSNRISGFCGATLIHDDFVITAAHCYYDIKDEIRSIQLLVGATTNIVFNPANGNEFTTFGEDVYWAPDYPSSMARGSRANDIMLIKLENPVPEHYPRAILNTASNVPSVNSQVTAVGLGRTTTGGTQPDVLQHVDLDVYSSASCQVGYEAYDSQRMLCASRHGQNACLGDSGGPLVQSDGRGSDTLVGVISFGASGGGGCADEDPNSPSYHTRVSYFHDFIHRSVCDNTAHQTGMCASNVPAPTPVPAVILDNIGGGGGLMNCFTYPSSGWVDFDGKGCDWYAEWDRCSLFGDFYANNGIAANQACCACGGGSIAGQPVRSGPPTQPPSGPPTDLPSLQPIVPPTPGPTNSPTKLPSAAPSTDPSVAPSNYPSQVPSVSPTHIPSELPSQDSAEPSTSSPSLIPSSNPSSSPTVTASAFPSDNPSAIPTDVASDEPSIFPSFPPTESPSAIPSSSPPPTTLSPVIPPSPSPTTANPTTLAPKTTAPIAISNAAANEAVPEYYQWLGWAGCSPLSPCDQCQGDCDSNNDCLGYLKCCHDQSKTLGGIEGCTGSSEYYGDYCC